MLYNLAHTLMEMQKYKHAKTLFAKSLDLKVTQKSA